MKWYVPMAFDVRALLECTQRLSRANDADELAEASSDLEHLGQADVPSAIAVALIRLQMRQPVVLPLLGLLAAYKIWSFFGS